jgi:hypothetical protein
MWFVMCRALAVVPARDMQVREESSLRGGQSLVCENKPNTCHSAKVSAMGQQKLAWNPGAETWCQPRAPDTLGLTPDTWWLIC